MTAKESAKNWCNWNYFTYQIVEVLDDDEVVVYEDCGQDLIQAKARLSALRSVLTFMYGRKFFIQEQHFVSHIL